MHFLPELTNLILLIVHLLLKLLDVFLLVSCKLGKCGRTHVEFQKKTVFLVGGKVAFGLQLVNPVEPVVAPALAHLEFTLELSDNFLGSFPM